MREIRSALHRREREQTLARRAAAEAIETELKTTVAGLLLHSQLALSVTETNNPGRQAARGGRSGRQPAPAVERPDRDPQRLGCVSVSVSVKCEGVCCPYSRFTRARLWT